MYGVQVHRHAGTHEETREEESSGALHVTKIKENFLSPSDKTHPGGCGKAIPEVQRRFTFHVSKKSYQNAKRCGGHVYKETDV